MFPIQYPAIWAMYKKQVDSFWRVEEVDFSKDVDSWNHMLTSDDRHFLSMILAFFAASDGIVSENLATRFYNDVQVSEVRAFYALQLAMETIHSECYSLMIETFIAHKQTKQHLFDAVTTIPCIAKKAAWAQKWISTHKIHFASRLVAFACVEGIFFSGAFCSIFWLKQRGSNIMPGLCFSNELISRDEALHCEFAVLLYSKLHTKLRPARIHEIIRSAVDIETEFICESLPCRLIGMNADLMTQYIHFVADRLCLQLGCPALYGVTNPFAFMDLISVEKKTNFFEHRVSEYSLATKATPTESLCFDHTEVDF